MRSKNEVSLMRKVVYCIVFLWGVFYYFGVSSQSVVRALVVSVDIPENSPQAGFEQGEALSTFKKFAVIGDYGYAGQPEADVAALVKGWNPDFIVTVGDNNYTSGLATTIDANIGQYFHEFIYPYTGSYGAGASVNKFFPILGNHDWQVINAKPYTDYFTLPGNERYYDFVQGSVHFFMLDSDSLEPDGITQTSIQANWLKNKLAASTSPWKIVVLHHAPFTSGMQGSSTKLQWPYEAWGADVVLAGHDHTYERIEINGFPYFVNGLGGRNIYDFGTAVTGSQVRYNDDYGAMLVRATDAYVNFQFITRTGIIIDSYTLGAIPPLSVNSIVLANANPTHFAEVNFTVSFSEEVNGVDISDFDLMTSGVSDAAVSGVSGSGGTYTVAVNTGTGDGTIRLDIVNDGTIKNVNLDSLQAGFTDGQVFTVDKTMPIVASSLRINPNSTDAANVNFAVHFSEPVFDVDQADFNLITTGAADFSITGVSGTGSDYTVAVSTGSGNGTIELEVPVGATATDLAANPLGSLPFNSGQIYKISKYLVLNAPILRSPRTNIVAAVMPTFWWTKVREAKNYEIVFAATNNFSNIVDSQIVNETSYAAASFVDGNYFWRVRANNANDQPGDWSSTRSFSIDTSGPSAPVLSLPANNASTRTPTFRWGTVSGAVLYEFQYDDASDFSSPNYTITVRGTFRRPPAMGLGTYSWHVRAKDASGNWGAWSVARTVNITGP